MENTKTEVHCDICDETVEHCYLPLHLESKKHQLNLYIDQLNGEYRRLKEKMDTTYHVTYSE